MTKSRSLLLHLAVFGFYLLVALVITYPLITRLSSVLVGFVHGDGYEMAHHLWWIKTALQTGQNPFFMPNLAYPAGLPAVILWSDPLQFFPAWLLAFVLPLPAAANLTILLTLALNGWAMFFLSQFLIITPHPPAPFSHTRGERGKLMPSAARLSRGEGFRNAPALLAGLIFMLYPTMQGHLGAGHAGLLVQWTVPLYVYALLRLREHGGRRGIALARIGAAALFFFLSATGHTLQVIYVVAPLTLVYGLMLIARREWAALRRTVIAAGIGAAALALFLVPVLGDTLSISAYADEGGAVRYSADLLAVVTPSFRHPLFDRLAYPHDVLGVNLDEGAAYIGVIAALLALIAVWKVRAARWWVGLALLAWMLSLGPLLKIFDQPVSFTIDGYASYVTLPFALIANLPLISLARTPGRFNFALALAVAALAGYGAAYLWDRVRLNRLIKWGAAALLLSGIAFEYQVFFPLPLTPADIPQAVTDLGARGNIRAVLDLPTGDLVAAKAALYLQTAHHLPLIAGQVTRSTPVSPAKLALLQAALDPALLRSVGADAVIVHRDQDDGTFEARARAQLGDPVYVDAQLAIFVTPATNATPEFTQQVSDGTTLTTQLDSYVYAPDDGWIEFRAHLSGDNRAVTLLLDDVVAGRWRVDGETDIDVPLPVRAGDFNTVSLALDPVCPAHFDAGLACRSVAVNDWSQAFVSAEVFTPVTFERGVTLANTHLPPTAHVGETIPVWLAWQFTEPRDENDVRFVHITDAAGALVAQDDTTLGSIAAGEMRAESVGIALPDDLPPGEYTVSVGWYHYPDITNFCVLTDGACAGSLVTLGTVEVTG